jgi:hypothetical protein
MVRISCHSKFQTRLGAILQPRSIHCRLPPKTPTTCAPQTGHLAAKAASFDREQKPTFLKGSSSPLPIPLPNRSRQPLKSNALNKKRDTG